MDRNCIRNYFFFDLDFKIRRYFWEPQIEKISEGVTVSPMDGRFIWGKNGILVKAVNRIHVTGSLLELNMDYLRTSCPFSKDRVKDYNQAFPLALVLSVNEQRYATVVMAHKRIVRQILDAIKDDIQLYLNHQITLSGFEVKIALFSTFKAKYMLVESVILDGLKYQ